MEVSRYADKVKKTMANIAAGREKLPLQGLRRRRHTEGDDPDRRRVPASLHAARLAQEVREDPPLRTAGQSATRGEVEVVPSPAA